MELPERTTKQNKKDINDLFYFKEFVAIDNVKLYHINRMVTF